MFFVMQRREQKITTNKTNKTAKKKNIRKLNP